MINNLKYIVAALFVASNLSINAMESNIEAGADSPRTPAQTEVVNIVEQPCYALELSDSSDLENVLGELLKNASSSDTPASSRNSNPILSAEERAAKDKALLESTSDKKLEDATEEEYAALNRELERNFVRFNTNSLNSTGTKSEIGDLFKMYINAIANTARSLAPFLASAEVLSFNDSSELITDTRDLKAEEAQRSNTEAVEAIIQQAHKDLDSRKGEFNPE